ncbi:hypothetical protein K435DRAFT_38204 [Dendrothele bispora CBS 962.96]|uniref:DUF6533 domain-containing protein n=1 Tax=Dendrothele bispora (strain CBS 962.96) TaxID=1314807 RepID=A0A4S8M8G2_DENBC|nr:hypothetical protein K435DRAFT_38204 [Dendrothele bispora CBS 962.96]
MSLPLHNGSPAFLPNPTTPLAFIPQPIADTIQLAIYVSIGSTAMFVWDILINISKDWRLITQHDITLPTIVYFTSRFCTLGTLLAITIFFTARLSDCQAAVIVLEAFFFSAMAATTLLFFFRIRAIYSQNRWVVAAFFLLWLANLGCSTTDFFLGNGFHIGPTKYCVILEVKIAYALIPAVAVLVHDTIIFTAISLKLYAQSKIGVNRKGESRAELAKDLISGRKLPKFSRAILLDGQVYYMISFLTTTVVIIMLVIPSLPLAYHLMMIGPHIAVVNAMACYVYRSVRFGIIKEGPNLSVSSVPRTSAVAPGINLLPLHRNSGHIPFSYQISDGGPKFESTASLTSPSPKYGPRSSTS